MKTSERGINLIKQYESFRAEAYRCPAGVWTIGYGHTRDVKPGDKITEPEALQLLRQDVQTAEKAVYNTGSGNFASSTLLEKINRNPDDPAIAAEFRKWVYGGGRRLPGLVTRREKESNLYFSRL